jgi:hypothetical protein
MRAAESRSSSERGAALIMVLIVSVLCAALSSVGRAETMSSLNYKTMSQARYGAESGLHSAVNHLLYTYTAPGDVGDPLATYDLTKSPVEWNNADVVISTDPGVASNYPVAAKIDAFNNVNAAGALGTLQMNNGTVGYTARARLLSMRQISDAYSGLPTTIQTWEVTGVGRILGAGSADVEVMAIVERQTVPAFRYAAFATHPGCDALNFGGGATTNSYDSSAALVAGVPVLSASGGNVGTNGNLHEIGNTTTINGTLSTPRSGVGNCTANNVTALTVNGNATVTGGLVELPQAIAMPTPAAISPAPPLVAQSITKVSGCPAGTPGVAYCAPSVNGVTFTPTNASTVVSLGNVTLGAQGEIHLNAGIYELNSITMVGQASLIVDSGPVIIRVAGDAQTTPIDMTGGTTTNATFNPSNLQIVYGGTGNVKLTGGTSASMLAYAPNSTTSITGGGDFYGSVIAKVISDMGGAAIHYDRRLQTTALTAGNPTMTTFSWSAY